MPDPFRNPAPIQIYSEMTFGPLRVWTATHNGELISSFTNGQDAIECVHKELCAHAAHLRAQEAQRKKERNAAIAKTAMNILSRIAANQLNKK